MPPVPVNVMMSLLSKTKEILSLVTTHHTTGCSIFIWSFIDVLQANIMMDSKVLFTTNDVVSLTQVSRALILQKSHIR